MRAILALEMGCGLGVSVWSMRSLLDSELRERGRGGEGIESKTGCPVQSSKVGQKVGPN
jgi:hypothetical protein